MPANGPMGHRIIIIIIIQASDVNGVFILLGFYAA
jgi:hypothetical protein